MAPTQIRHPAMKLNTFPLFRLLPPEVRLMVWEATWPEARVIEAAYAEIPSPSENDDDNDDDGPDEYVTLRMAGRLSTWLQSDFRFGILEDPPLEKCLDPVALWVCRESRAHTLRRFACMRHPRVQAKAFYFRPDRDLLWLNSDVTDDLSHQRELRGHYGKQLDRIESVLVEEEEWAIPGVYPDCLGMLQGLQSIQVILDPVAEQVTAEEGAPRTGRAEYSGPGWAVQYIDRPV